MNILKLKMSNKNKFWISMAVLAITAVVSFSFVIGPNLNKINKVRLQLSNLQAEVETNYLQDVNMKNFIQNIKDVEDQMASLDKIYLKPSQELEFVTILEAIAEKKSLKQKINLIPMMDKKIKLKKLNLQVDLDGKLTDCLGYLHELNKLNYYINIQNINLNLVSEEADLATMSFSAEVYQK